MTLGFEQAGFDVLASVEIDPIHCAVHRFNFPQWSIICRDVADISGMDIRKHSTIQHQEIDVVFGGSPCQGFSLIGKRALDDPRNSLVAHFMRLVTELEPKYFVLENVKGLTLGRHRQFLEEVILAFQERGYRVREDYRVLNAVHYGVPQNRERLFLMGCKGGLLLPEYPEPITKRPQSEESLLVSHLPSAPTVWEAIADLPEVEHYPELLHGESCLADYGMPKGTYGAVMRGRNHRADDYSYLRQWHPQLLTSSLRTLHSDVTIQRFRETPHGKIDPVSRFLRLDPNGVCNTLRAGTASNRGSFTSPRPIHPFRDRCITVREAARLHSYPDWFRFHGTKWHGFRQIGNSVPPLLAMAVAKDLIKVLKIQPRKDSEPIVAGDDDMLLLNMGSAAKFFQVHPHAIEPRARRSKKNGG